MNVTTLLRGEVSPDGRFFRTPPGFVGRVTADGSSGFPAAPRRYHLYASLACPYSHQTLIVHRLMGLDEIIGVTIADPVCDERGWRFEGNPEGRDPITGARLLAELYQASDPTYEGPYTVPALWDTGTGQLVSNDFSQIAFAMGTQFRGYCRPDAPDLYPAQLRQQIDAVSALVFEHVNNGVYKAGLATSQQAYDHAVDAVFTTLDAMEQKLSKHRYLVGDRLTAADVLLYPALFRFDAVYYSLFKCSVRRLVDYPHLWAYARDLYQRPGFADTSNLEHVKRHYFLSPISTPEAILPKGPAADWTGWHGRDRIAAY